MINTELNTLPHLHLTLDQIHIQTHTRIYGASGSIIISTKFINTDRKWIIGASLKFR